MGTNGSTPEVQMGSGGLIAPAPLGFATEIIRGPEQSWVALRFETVHGSFCFLIDPDVADNVGQQIIAAGKAGKSDLIVPPGLGL